MQQDIAPMKGLLAAAQNVNKRVEESIHEMTIDESFVSQMNTNQKELTVKLANIFDDVMLSKAFGNLEEYRQQNTKEEEMTVSVFCEAIENLHAVKLNPGEIAVILSELIETAEDDATINHGRFRKLVHFSKLFVNNYAPEASADPPADIEN
jgi:hypothetical protein